MNGPTEREQQWQQILRDHFPRPANLMTMHKPALAVMAEADRESAALRARVAVLEQQIAAIRDYPREHNLVGSRYKDDHGGFYSLGWNAGVAELAAFAAGVVGNPTEDEANADPFTLDDLGHPTEEPS